MTRIIWGELEAKTYETGLDRGVVYPFGAGWEGSGKGVPWNGLVSVTENVSGGEVESYYYDGVKYMDVILYEDYQATLEAFDAPPEFGVCDGSRMVAMGLFAGQQPRRPFDLCYRTGVGDGITEEKGFKIHLLYNLMAAPAERTRKTRSADVEMATTSWTLYGKPPKAGVSVIDAGQTYKPTAHLIIDTRYLDPLDPTQLEIMERRIYGFDGFGGVPANDPEMPTQQEFITFLDTGFWT